MGTNAAGPITQGPNAELEIKTTNDEPKGAPDAGGDPIADGPGAGAPPRLQSSVLHLAGVIMVMDDLGAAVASAPMARELVHVPGSSIAESFRYLTGKAVADCLTQPAVEGSPALDLTQVPVPPAPETAADPYPKGAIWRICCEGSPLHGVKVRNRGTLDIGIGAAPGCYSVDILEGPAAGETTTVYPGQFRPE